MQLSVQLQVVEFKGRYPTLPWREFVIGENLNNRRALTRCGSRSREQLLLAGTNRWCAPCGEILAGGTQGGMLSGPARFALTRVGSDSGWSMRPQGH